MGKARVEKILWRGFELDFSRRSAVMGILNITDDSFSDGGLYRDKAEAVKKAKELAAEGADIIDIGPESSRPGSKRISARIQIERAVPIISELSSQIEKPISIDTYIAEVAEKAIDAGAAMINDITAGSDEDMFALAAAKDVPIVIMHIQGTPETMQKNPVYSDVASEVYDYLIERAHIAEQKGVKKSRIIIDPGIGFGKTLDHNIRLLANMEKFVESGYPVLLGASRKRFIGQITQEDNPANRHAGTLAVSAIAARAGVQIVRVHEAADNLDAVKIASTIRLSAENNR